MTRTAERQHCQEIPGYGRNSSRTRAGRHRPAGTEGDLKELPGVEPKLGLPRRISIPPTLPAVLGVSTDNLGLGNLGLRSKLSLNQFESNLSHTGRRREKQRDTVLVVGNPKLAGGDFLLVSSELF